jgi:hypothetical protein
MLAKVLNFGEVIYLDTHEASCEDAKKIAGALHLKANIYVTGDVEDLVKHAHSTHRFNAITSHDVLEHIYDVRKFFTLLSGACDPGAVVVMSTGANIHNPRLRNILTKKHLEAEHKDIPKLWNMDKRDATTSYYKIRGTIIRSYAPDLSKTQVEELSSVTRGLIRPQIISCVDEYKKFGRTSYTPDHPTNTCCPTTGYWAERLTPASKYLESVRYGGFVGSVRGGRYYPYGRWKPIRVIVNSLIDLMGPWSINFAPHILFEGKLRPAKS